MDQYLTVFALFQMLPGPCGRGGGGCGGEPPTQHGAPPHHVAGGHAGGQLEPVRRLLSTCLAGRFRHIEETLTVDELGTGAITFCRK